MVHEIDHMSDLHVDSSFYNQSMKIDNCYKITEWIDSSIGQSTVTEELDKKRPKLSNLNQMQNRRRYVNFENGSYFICNLRSRLRIEVRPTENDLTRLYKNGHISVVITCS